MTSPRNACAILCLGLLLAACPAHNDEASARARAQDGTATATPARAQERPSSGTASAAPAAADGAQVVLLPPGRDPVTVKVEVADEEGERQRGLMFRKQLAADAGMLFLFERPQHLTFWMHNTYLPLDMIFIEPSLAILGVVENAEPLTDTTRAVSGNSQYVLEVNAGFSREHGLAPGTLVRFVGVDQTAVRGER